MRILGIETSCDETGLAIYESERGLLGQVLHSQVALHRPHGGVVPELASRDHAERIGPLLKQLLLESKLSLSDLSAIAYTKGPGLIGALMVGGCFARGLATALGLPIVPVHHLEGHILATFLSDLPLSFPFTALLVSGGHSLFLSADALGQYRVLGGTLDDAAGEAFDKTAKLLGLGYPGGAALSRLARQGTPGRFVFPRPMIDRPGVDLSFSGLKTFAWHTFEKTQKTDQDKADLALAFEKAVIDTLFIKCQRALQLTGHDTLVVSGGVSANQPLRSRLTQLITGQVKQVLFPSPAYCTDNGAMIAYAGYLRYQAGLSIRPGEPAYDEIDVRAKWPISALSSF